MSVKPKYNDKIKVFVAISPVVFLSLLTSPLYNILPYIDLINTQLQLFKLNEIIGFYSLSKAVLEQVCSQKTIGYRFCLNSLLFPLIGFDPSEYEAEFVSVVFGHYPAGTSRQNLENFGHIAVSHIFGQPDYGAAKNLVVYGSTTAPRYDLSRVSVETYMFTARNDRVSSLKDIAVLKKMLPRAVHDRVMESPTFNHLDYIWGREGHKIVAQDILHILKDYVGA